MNVYVYQTPSGQLLLRLRPYDCGIDLTPDFIGELDLPIVVPKKTVVKEVIISENCVGKIHEFAKRYLHISDEAKNIKLTYEVEE